MAWNKNIPQGTDKISQSPTPIRGNWKYIETTLQKDHFFADSAPGKDGHHHFAQFDTPALTPTLDGANGFFGGLYAKQIGSTKGVPYWNLAGTTEVLQLVTNYSQNTPLNNNNPMDLYDFGLNGIPNMTGFLFAYDIADPTRTIFSPFTYYAVVHPNPPPGLPAGIYLPGASGQLSSSSGSSNQAFVKFQTKSSNKFIVQLVTDGANYSVNLRVYGNVIS